MAIRKAVLDKSVVRKTEQLPPVSLPAKTVDTKTNVTVPVSKPALVEVAPTKFDGLVPDRTRELGQVAQNVPSAALTEPGRRLHPSLFAELLEKPMVKREPVIDKPAWVPLQAKLPPSRTLPVGEVTFSHADGKLSIRGGAPKQAPEVVDKKLGFADAARWAVGFDAALSKQYPRFSTDEPKELWIAFLDARRAADVALNIDEARSPFDVGQLLRQFTPGAKPIAGAQTINQQLEAFGALARSVMDGGGTPLQNAIRLEEQGLQAKDSSLLMQLIEQADNKTSKTSPLDDLLRKPGVGTRPTLPDDDKAVVAHLDGKDITAGDIRAMALRTQPAVQFLVPGFKDANGHEHALQVHIERKDRGFEWSFYGVDKKIGGMRVLSGELSPRGLEQFRQLIEEQGRWDMNPYKTSGERSAPGLTETALAALVKDRDDLETLVKSRQGTPVDESFPNLRKD